MESKPNSAATAAPSPKVALTRCGDRRGAVAQALALIADNLRVIDGSRTVIKPNLVSHRRQTPSTHADALSVVLDAVLSAGPGEITIAEGASDASKGFERFGYHRETYGRPVRYFDLNRDETEWDRVALLGADGSTLNARISRTIVDASCRVSLALAKTHVVSGVTFSLKNMLSSIHPDDRIMMHGYPQGNGQTGWKAAAVQWLKGDSAAVHWATRVLGRVRNLKNWAKGKTGPNGFERLSAQDRKFLRSVMTLNQNLALLNQKVRPHLSVIDGFIAMHREGPRHGTPIPLGVAIAGTDPVAVDSVAAAVMGFDPREIGSLACAEALGLGCADLARMEIVGDPIAEVRRRCVPHSNDAVHRHWKRAAEPERLTAHPQLHPHFSANSAIGARG